MLQQSLKVFGPTPADDCNTGTVLTAPRCAPSASMQTVAGAPDVRPVLERRFGMLNWFKRHGYPDSLWQQQPQPQLARRKSGTVARAAPVPHPAAPVPAAADLQVVIEDVVDRAQTPLLVFDWDKTLTDWDAGE